MTNEVKINPIGFVHSKLEQRYETPHQGVLVGNNISVIALNSNHNFDQALKDLEGFERIWIIYQFHLNKNWKPLVTPPRNNGKKVGVFASRAPYRPNQIGLSCVKLLKVEGLKIYISESDLLNGTPVIDIKPYLPYSDSFPNAKTGWVKTDLKSVYKVAFTKKTEEKALNIFKDEKINLLNYARVQLEFNPTDTKRKRITFHNKKDKKSQRDANFQLAYREWNIIYKVNLEKKIVSIKDIFKSSK